MKKEIIVGGLAFLLLGGLGCIPGSGPSSNSDTKGGILGGVTERIGQVVEEDEDFKTVRTGKNELTVTDKATGDSFTVMEKEVPKGFPDYIPYPKDANITTAIAFEGEQIGANLTFFTDMSVEEAREWYKKEMPKNGWTYDSGFVSAGEVSDSWSHKGTNEGGFLNINSDSGITEVGITVMEAFSY